MLLGGCTSFQPSTSFDADWTLKGRLLIKGDGPARRLSVFWQQTNQDFEIVLNASLGTPVARLVSQGNRHFVELPGEAPRYSPSVDQLLTELTGFDLPLAAFTRILRADIDQMTVGPWLVRVLQRDTFGRPEKLQAEHQPVNIQLVVTEWQ